MKDPISTNEEFVRDISELRKGINGSTDTFKWEIAYKELVQSQSVQKQKVKLPREGEGEHRNESIRSLEGTNSPIANADGHIERFSVVDPGMAERKRMEAARQAAHDELEARSAARTDELLRVADELRTEIAEREKREAALQAAHDELEAQSATRTDELLRVADELRTEIAEREKREAALQAAHDELEAQSATRTDELLRVADELRTEIAEREKREAALQAAHDELEARAAIRMDELLRVADGLRTEIAERMRMESVLQAAHDELEQHSMVRTDELLRVNDGLQNEIAERMRTEEALRAAHAELEARAAARTDELMQVNDKLRTEITEFKKAEEQLQHTLDNFQTVVGTTIQVMGSAVEIKDPHSAGHQLRSTVLARNIARMMGLSRDQINIVRMACSIHDIGKLSIPAEILSKPGKLSEIEFPLIKAHAKRGYEILKDIEFPWPLAEIVHQHHERMDGSGYPRNLKGDEICVEARIMAVADVVEAMVSTRAYRPALGIEAALEEIERNSGTLYDSTVVGACLQLFREKDFQFAEA